MFLEYLCHYTNAKKAKLILEKMTLKFGKVSKSNDPIEIKIFTAFLPYNDIEKEILEENRIKKQLKLYLNKILQLICFSEGDIRNIKGDIDDDGEEIDIKDDIIDAAKLEDFSKRPPYYLPRMWSQYGDNHKGVCFIFNKDKLIDQVDEQSKSLCNFKHKYISYKDILKDDIFLNQAVSLLYSYVDVSKNIETFVQDYLINNNDLNYFTKDIDWKDEHEYRFLLWNMIKNKDYNNKIIHIDNKSLIGIVLGLCNDKVQCFAEVALKQSIKNIFKLKNEDSFIGLYKL